VVRYACAATYATSFAKTNVCLAGSVKITMEATCRAAAAAFGKQYALPVSRPDRPSGCFLTSGGLLISGGTVYFNTDSIGDAFANAQPLCYVTGEPPKPPPPRAHLRGTPWGRVPSEGVPR
jgi:hypothetical protein